MVLCCCSFQPSLLVSMLLCASLKVQRCRYASIFHTSGATNYPISSVGGHPLIVQVYVFAMIFLLCAVASTLSYFEWNRKTLCIKLDVLKLSLSPLALACPA